METLRRRAHSFWPRLKNLWRIFQYMYVRIRRIDDTPEKIAWGLAFGVFLGVFPTFGAGAIFAVLGARAMRINRFSAILGTFVSNPFTYPFWLSASVLTGAALYREKTATLVHKVLALWEPCNITSPAACVDALKTVALGKSDALTALVIYLTGNTLLSIVSALITYVLCKRAVVLYRARRERRLAARGLRRPRAPRRISAAGGG